jgi:hypothetical protein
MNRGTKIVIYICFFVILAGLLYQVYKIDTERRFLVKETANVLNNIEEIKSDNQDLLGKIDYFSDPRNLEKELRARFNYRFPNEKLIIVVPNQQNDNN